MPDINGELETLRRENARLRKLLKLTDAEAAPARSGVRQSGVRSTAVSVSVREAATATA